MVAGRSGGHASKLALSRPFKGFRLPKRRSKLQKSKIELKVTKNGFRLEAFDWENLSLKNACALVFSGRRALDTAARRFPGVCQELSRSVPEASRSRQIAKIWPQKAPGQDWPKTGRFPIVPEGGFNCGPKPANCQNWLQKLPARIWPKNGRFTIVEGAFNCGPEAAKLPKFGSKRLTQNGPISQ